MIEDTEFCEECDQCHQMVGPRSLEECDRCGEQFCSDCRSPYEADCCDQCYDTLVIGAEEGLEV